MDNNVIEWISDTYNSNKDIFMIISASLNGIGLIIGIFMVLYFTNKCCYSLSSQKGYNIIHKQNPSTIDITTADDNITDALA